jgi:hypothetical protein
MEEDILPSGKNNFHGCVYCIAFGQPTSGDMFAEKGYISRFRLTFSSQLFEIETQISFFSFDPISL